MTSKHTQGPWTAENSLVYFPNVLGGFDLRACPHPKANADRIVDCVNAMQGIEDPAAFMIAAREWYKALVAYQELDSVETLRELAVLDVRLREHLKGGDE